jgi:hypothetical protein
LLVVYFFHDRPTAAYFGLAFPQPPGKIMAASFTFALLGTLLMLHAAAKAIFFRGQRS